jgi:beta-1,4-N-acetylglucosaminyltransferase
VNKLVNNRKLKVCLISSSGGHLAQLKQLLPLVSSKYNYFLVTEKNETSLSLQKKHPTFFLKQQERKNISFLKNFTINVFKSVWILLKQKPDVIISTGAGAVLPLCVLGALFGKKVVFLESFAKITSPTITGRIIYKFADRFYVQWEEMNEIYPKATYKGAIY